MENSAHFPFAPNATQTGIRSGNRRKREFAACRSFSGRWRVLFCSFLLSSDACHEAADFLRGFFFHACCDVCVNVQREFRRGVTEDLHDRFRVDAALDCQRRECMPLRYNYDKPEKPRISRVFGYLARFFILFQTEKSSREVVIS